jgi:tripartite-type tricarboxylate transporter receptor subunit TctC
MRNWLRSSLAFAALLIPFAAAHAQSSYPDRPIRLIVAFVPGGATDTLGRQIINDLAEGLGQSVIIENRPGANGYLAWNHVAAAEPDGYTLLLAENALAISQALHKKATSPFDPLTQYVGIAGIATSPSVLLVSNNVPVNSVAELVAYSKSVPNKLNFASAGVGSVSHLIFEVFKDGVGMDAVHIPYKGGGQSINDVVAGHVPMTLNSIQASKGLVETGKVKGLGVTSAARSPALPNVPTLVEAGMRPPPMDMRFWFALFAPKGLPEPIKAKIENVVSSMLAKQSLRDRLARLDISPDFVSGPALQAKLGTEIQSWTRFIDSKGIKPQ